MALGCEACLALRVLALVWLLASVEPQMGLEVAFLRESAAAVFNRTGVVAFTLVLVQVHLEALLPGVGLGAARVVTHELAHLQVGLRVVFEVPARHEGLATGRHVAHKRFFLLLTIIIRIGWGGDVRDFFNG